MSIMEIKQVGYSYDNKKKVLKGVNAEMEQGKLYAILGPSGCGKTTLLSPDRRPGQPRQRPDLLRWAGYCQNGPFRPSEKPCGVNLSGV